MSSCPRRAEVQYAASAFLPLYTGHPDMPEIHFFEPEEVGAIIDYLQSIQEQ